MSTEHDYDSIMNDISRNILDSNKKLLINTANIRPTTYTTKNGLFSVAKDGTVNLDLSLKRRRKFKITPDGQTVRYDNTQIYVTNVIDDTEQRYNYEEIPSKYLSVYKYAYGILNLIKSKIPKAKLEKKTGRFILMMNEPNPNYEAHYSSGLMISHTVGSNLVTVKKEGESRDIKYNTKEMDTVSEEVQEQIRTAMKYLEVLCNE